MKKRILSIILAVIMVIGVLPIAAVPAFAEGSEPVLQQEIPAALQNTSWKGEMTIQQYSETSTTEETGIYVLQIGTDSAYFTYNNKTVILPFVARIKGEDEESLMGEFLVFQKDTDECEVGLAVQIEDGAVLGIICQQTIGVDHIDMISTGDVTKITTLRDILDEVGGTYSYRGDGIEVSEGGKVTVISNFALSSSSFENEFRAEYQSLFIYGEKELYDTKSKKNWTTGQEQPAIYGEPEIDYTKTIEDVLNATLELTETEMKIEYDDLFRGKGFTTVPAGSYYCEALNVYFFTTEDGLKKVNFFGVELTREETEPRTLRDIIGKVSGTYSINVLEASVTITIEKDKYCLEEVNPVFAQRIICDNTGTKTWTTKIFEQGQPVFNTEPDYTEEDKTIDKFLNSEIKTVEEEMPGGGAVIPVGSYSVDTGTIMDTLIFFDEDEDSGKTQKFYTSAGDLVLIRVGGSTHEHTFSDEWSNSATHHWHEATCEHTELTKSLGEHIFGNDGKCTVCGYEKKTDALTEAKTAMKEEIDNAVNGASDAIVTYAATAKANIDACTSITELVTVYTAELNKINGMKTDEAIAAAIAELEKATENVLSTQSVVIANTAKALIEKAESEYEVTGILEKALEKIKIEEESAEFAAEKAAAIAEIEKFVNENVPVETKELSLYTETLAKVKNYINASTTKAEVIERKATALKILDDFVPEYHNVAVGGDAKIVSKELVPLKSTKYEVVTVEIKEANGINENGDWFVYWKDQDGNIVSTYSTYQFFAVEDRTLTPVYVNPDNYDDERAKAVIVTDIVRTTDNKNGTVTLFAEHSASAKAVGSILQHGIIWTTDAEQKDNLTWDNELVKKASANTSNTALTGLLRTTIEADGANTVYARSFITDASGNTVYGDVEEISVAEATVSSQSVTTNTLESVAEQSEEIIPTANETETAPTFVTIIMNIIKMIVTAIQSIIALF